MNIKFSFPEFSVVFTIFQRVVNILKTGKDSQVQVHLPVKCTVYGNRTIYLQTNLNNI